MPAPKEVRDLVARFAEHIDAYKRGNYNETQLRREFLDPFFGELGWDVANKNNYAGDYKDVVHEAALKIGGTTKAPDYSFRIGGQRKFFVEAKKPSVDVKGDPHPAYQLRRYAWTAQLPLSILTDFEEFAVYDCRIKPSPKDKAATARILYMTYDEYEERWDEIESVFARTAILKGAFDKYASKKNRKRGTAEPDDEFLHLLESWRAKLAQNLARSNDLTARQLNHAVQLIIDRIVFLRICEDRGVEVAETLRGIAKNKNVYRGLLKRFRLADAKYNSGLFHFENEPGREAPDTLTPALNVGDAVLKDIIQNLYYPESPYEFSVFRAEMLGHIYERFLGSVISLSSTGKTAKVEEKPEVRKAGGVYYTPTYIVDYIVEHTVGELLKDRTIEIAEVGQGRGKKKLKAPRMDRPLRVLDPACGSGSFLLGAYDHLLDWHLKFYTKNDPDVWATLPNPPIAHEAIPDEKATSGDYRLTTSEKKRILTEHIFGVDIDAQAVEVTKLSLLLKVLEGESKETLEPLLFANERALPDLSDNIKCGNSLIGSDFYKGQQAGMFDEEAQYRINAFDWDVEFKEIMAGGGFEAIIGNPPYIRIQAMKKTRREEVEYLLRRFVSAGHGNFDIYVAFVERGVGLLAVDGLFGNIVPHKFMNARYGQPLRALLSKSRHVSQLVHFTDQQVFPGASTYTCLLFLNRSGANTFRAEYVTALDDWQAGHPDSSEASFVDSATLTSNEWNIQVGSGAELFGRLDAMPTKLASVGHIFVGLQTSADTVFLFKNAVASGAVTTSVFSKELGREVQIETALLRPVIRSGAIGRYSARASALVLFPYLQSDEGLSLIGESQMQSEYPQAYDYLQQNRELLEGREGGKFKASGWYQLYPKNLDVWEDEKIMLPYMVTRLAAYLDSKGQYFVNVTTGGFGLRVTMPGLGHSYLTGLLNSTLLDWFMRRVSTNFRGGYFAANKQFLVQLPICVPHQDDHKDCARHDRVVELVQSMLDMNQRLHGEQAAKLTPQEKRVLEGRIAATDREIDQLVYELYGLTDEEIATVEESTRSQG